MSRFASDSGEGLQILGPVSDSFPLRDLNHRHSFSNSPLLSSGDGSLKSSTSYGSFGNKWFPTTPLENFGGSPSFVQCLISKDSSIRLKEISRNCKSEMVASSIDRLLDLSVGDALVSEVERGYLKGHPIVLAEDCCGGTYFLRDSSGDVHAVYKPSDEEPYAPHNPKGYVGSPMYGTSPMKEGVDVGAAAERECAAYLLDHLSAARVPQTIMMRIRAAPVKFKSGSLQRFVKSRCSSEDMGPSRFPCRDVHFIAMLDIRLCNSDRHPGNILVQENRDGGVQLVPIDHGYALPKWRCLHEMDFCWLNWPQSKSPFSVEELRYIELLDIESETDLLHTALGLPDDSLRTLRISTTLLKLGAKAGLTLFDIGSLMVRQNLDTRSVLEEEVAKSEDETLREMRRSPQNMRLLPSRSAVESIFLRHLTMNLQQVIAKITPTSAPCPCLPSTCRAESAASTGSFDDFHSGHSTLTSTSGGLCEMMDDLEL